MLKENIIVIGEIPESKAVSQKVPEWVKNTANWWANDLIDEADFVSGLQFLIENGIIKI